MLEAWRRAGRRIRSARTRAGYRTLDDFAAAAGIGRRTLADLETGRRDTFSDQTLDRVESVLRWYPGQVRDIVAGKRRRPRYEADLQRLIDLWPVLDPGSQRMLVELAERVVRDLG